MEVMKSVEMATRKKDLIRTSLPACTKFLTLISNKYCGLLSLY